MALFEPLMWDISPAERLLTQHNAALIVVHELAHATWALIKALDQEADIAVPTYYEPFFENESIAELGWSMCVNVFGGAAHELYPENDTTKAFERISLAEISTSWPARSDLVRVKRAGDGTALFHNEAERATSATSTIYPIHISYFDKMQQVGFWDNHADTYSIPALRFTATEGRRVRNTYRKGFSLLRWTGPYSPEFYRNEAAKKLNSYIRYSWDCVHRGVKGEQRIAVLARQAVRAEEIRNLLDVNLLHGNFDWTAGSEEYPLPYYRTKQKPPDPHAHVEKNVHCPRYTEIRDMIWKNRGTLGLETLDHFQADNEGNMHGMPENLLYRWIKILGHMPDLTAEEFRTYLHAATEKGELLR